MLTTALGKIRVEVFGVTRYRANPTGSVEDSIRLSEELDAAKAGSTLTLTDGYYFTKLAGSTWRRKDTRRVVNSRIVAVLLRARGGSLK